MKPIILINPLNHETHETWDGGILEKKKKVKMVELQKFESLGVSIAKIKTLEKI
jgi:hypothetical protein